MITQIDITGIQYEAKEDIKKYIRKKIGRLDRFVPRHARKSIKAEVILKELKTKADRNQCEVILHLPEQMITAKDSTINMFAAVDIVEKVCRLLLRHLIYPTLHMARSLPLPGATLE